MTSTSSRTSTRASPRSGTFVSSLKDANPAAGRTPKWTTLSFTATTPAGTAVKFQVAGEQQPVRPVQLRRAGRDAGTFFTTSGAEPEPVQRHALPPVQGVPVDDERRGHAVALVRPRLLHGRRGDEQRRASPSTRDRHVRRHDELSATLTSGGNGVSGETVAFTLNGSSVGGASTNASGVATLEQRQPRGHQRGLVPDRSRRLVRRRRQLRPEQRLRLADRRTRPTRRSPTSRTSPTSGDRPALHGQRDGRRLGQRGHVLTASAACSVQRRDRHDPCRTAPARSTYDQAGDSNYNAAPQVTQSSSNCEGGADDHVPGDHRLLVVGRLGDAHRDGELRASRSRTACAPGRAASPAATLTANHAGSCVGRRRPGRQLELHAPHRRRRENATVHEGRPDDQRDDARAGRGRLQHAVHRRRDRRRLELAGHVLERGRLLQHRRHVHDDERHRHLLGQVRPGRRQRLQRGAAGHRDRHRAEGDQTITRHHARAGERGLQRRASASRRARPAASSPSRAAASCSNIGHARSRSRAAPAPASVKYDQAGNANYNAAPQVTESVTAHEGRPDDHRHDPRAGVGGLQHELRVSRRRAAAPATRSRSRRAGACSNTRRHVHDDERHRHLHRQLRPGRQRELQRRAAGHRDRQRARRRARRST